MSLAAQVCYQNRRNRLISQYPHALFIFPAQPQCARNSDVYPCYRQESSFYYLSGFEEPHACLVLGPAPSHSSPNAWMTLFVQPQDPQKELWEGKLSGLQGAQDHFGAHQAYPIASFEEQLIPLLNSVDRVFYTLGFSQTIDGQVIRALQRHQKIHRTSGLLPLEDPRTVLAEHRLFKDLEEIKILRQACHITAHAHRTIMSEVTPVMTEREIAAYFEYLVIQGGCQRLGYPSIVANGKNATCLHYQAYQDPLKKGDLLLIDAGGEYHYYTADLSRTFPVSITFTKAQAKIYDLVLKAQKAGLQATKPGSTLPEIHQCVCQTLLEGLLSLNLLPTHPEQALQQTLKTFYPHSTSHWLGLDVHDLGSYFQDQLPRRLEPGMVLTLEPGLYFPSNHPDIPEPYRGLGIRIEDDLLITSDGVEILTQEAPKEREEIEALREKAWRKNS